MPLARTNVFPGSPVLQEAHSVTACPLFSLLPEELKFIPKGGSYLGFVLFPWFLSSLVSAVFSFVG